MQSSFIGSLMELSAEHEEVMYLTADSGEGGLDLMYRRNFPNRSFDFGIAEGNMVAAAAGMALSGKVPFVYTSAPFLVYRANEFIRDDVCLQNVPVKIFGSGSGLAVSSLGPTHHSTEDIAVLRCMPNLTVLSPATPMQAYESVTKAYNIPGPVYVRLGMNKEPEYFESGYKIPEAGIDVIGEGKDVLIVSTGTIICEAMRAMNILRSEGVDVTIASIFKLKPFDGDLFITLASQFEHFVIVEEHNIIGGLGSMISECLFKAGLQSSITKMGLVDQFTKGYGQLDDVRKVNKLDAESIVASVRGELQ